MAYPSVTYTFTNGTTADGTEVNTNFTNIINGLSDGTKDLNINALTCAGAAVLNGHVTLGSNSSDDLTFNAVMASTLPIKTNTTYDIGSTTKGISSLYFGASSTFTAGVTAATHAASRVYTIPDCGAAASFVMTQLAQTIAGTKTFSGQLIGMGTATNDDAASGYIGQFASNINTGTANNMPTSGQFGGDQDISLGAGDWDITAVAYITINGATITVPPDMFIGTVAGNDTTNRLLGSNYAKAEATAPSNDAWSLMIPSYRVSIASTTTYYLKLKISYSAGAPQYRHRISARRVR